MNLALASHHILVPSYPAVISTGSRLLTILLLLPKMLGPNLFAGQVKPFPSGPIPAVRLDPIGELEMLGHLELPNGTITLNLNRQWGVMEIFTEHDPHPSDWAITVQIIRLLCYPADLGEPDFLDGIDTWRILLKDSITTPS